MAWPYATPTHLILFILFYFLKVSRSASLSPDFT